jgi:2-keto-4-pentenoate hydratase
MEAVDQRLSAALATQLGRRDALLSAGARRVGWKLGMGDAERIGEGPAVGHLTTATQLRPGESFEVAEGGALHADVELAVEIGAGGRIAGYAAALELVDLGPAGEDPAQIVAANIFHRAFALGAFGPLPAAEVSASLFVDGESRTSAPVEDVQERIAAASRILATVGERLREGDRLITGSIVQEPVAAGEVLGADLGPLGSVHVRLADRPGRRQRWATPPPPP